ncbi:FxsA family membrane protein [Streptomyces sp. NPDC019396]|uniref:FxsA family membrane protein n=1 Tax=Streptomyces sp. NPDC019396 TaxID=3154687 RepID=UPI0033C05601
MTTGVRTPTAPRRSRARTFLPLGIAAWLLLEIWLLTLVAGAAGGFTVFALLVAGAVLGAVVIKRAGRRAFRNLAETFQQQGGATPATPADRQDQGNGLLMLGGLLLMLPGLISDAAGLLLLLPPVRRSAGRYAEKSLDRRMRQAAPGSLGDALRQARIHRPDGKVVQGEVIRQDAPPAPRPGTGQHPPLIP